MILHLDADAFFASVEQAADPRLRGKPVAVGGSSRGVVASASYEARRHGIASAMPVARARRLCPRLVVVPGDFEKYEHFSRLMFSYAYDFTPLVEVGSIDEGYADLHGGKSRHPRDIAAAIRRAVHQTLRITLSEGVAANKLTAQIAGKSKKPDALVEIPPGAEREFLAPLPAKWLPGIGPGLSDTLCRAGLPLIRDIAATPPADLALFAGKSARTLWEFAHGIDHRPVVPDPPAAKSLSEQQTFESDTTDEAFALAALRSMADRLFAQLRATSRAARTIAVRIRYSDFEESRRSHSLDEPISIETLAYARLADLLKKAWQRRVGLRLVSLQLSNLYAGPAFADLPLIEPSKNHARLSQLAAAVDRVRAGHGRHAILRGHDLWLRSRENQPRDPARPRTPQIHAPKAPPPAGALLHFRSCYSFLDSLLTPQRIVELAARAGCHTVGLCDTNLHAAVPFYQAARAAGLKPVIGAELPIGSRTRRLFARDETGYRNLCRLLSEKTITRDFWHAHRAGLAESTNPAPPIRCESEADQLHLRILASIRGGSLLPPNAPPAATFESATAHGPDARLAADCGFEFTFHELSFPRFEPPEAASPREFLARLAREGLARRYGPRAAAHRAQLETELSMVAAVGYEEYFLTVWDLLQHCRRDGIEWITRGSAADSLVCHCLGISDACPVRFELYFQRFLNPDRMALKKLPDIDLDFPHDRKDAVVEKLFRLHPAGHVAAVGGFHTFHARSALAEIGKTLGMPEQQVRRLTEHLPWLAKATDLDQSHRSTPAHAEGAFDNGPARTALALAARLEGLPRHPKLHPCGIVLSRRPIHDSTPTFESDKGWPATHFDMDAVEEVGLVKLDILAQGGLAVLRDTRAALAEKNLPPPPSFAGPWDDPAVWDMVANGEARGVHHIESPAMTNLAKMCACRDIDSLVAIVSVIRPGAANTLRKASFARRARGLEPATYPHPSLEPVLRLTHGVIAYEEHILQICEAFAGMAPGRADILRRALVKMRDAELPALRAEFEAAALARGRTPAETEAVWGLVHMFRGYAFCRAHSTAYALEAYQAAWAKKYHPATFLAAVLTHGKGFYSRLLYTLEARRLGLRILPPDLHASRPFEYFAPDPASIRVPLSAIKGIPEALVSKTAAGRAIRPFRSLNDFAARTQAPPHALELLLRAGALDSLAPSHRAAIWQIQEIARSGPSLLPAREIQPGAENAPRLQRLRDEMELLGFTAGGHPLELWPAIPWHTYCPIARLHEFPHRRVTVCGLVVAQRQHHQSDGQPMAFLTLCDHTGMVETELFARAHRRFSPLVHAHPVLEATGTVEPFESTGAFTLQIETLRPPRQTRST